MTQFVTVTVAFRYMLYQVLLFSVGKYIKSIYELYDGGYNASSSAIIDFVNLGLAPSVDTLIVSLSRCSALGNTTLPFDASPTLLKRACSGKAFLPLH